MGKIRHLSPLIDFLLLIARARESNAKHMHYTPIAFVRCNLKVYTYYSNVFSF